MTYPRRQSPAIGLPVCTSVLQNGTRTETDMDIDLVQGIIRTVEGGKGPHWVENGRYVASAAPLILPIVYARK